jgi:hypothetical protein
MTIPIRVAFPLRVTFVLGAACALAVLGPVASASGQAGVNETRPAIDPAHAAPLAVADAALAAITRGDWGAVADLMTPEAQAISVRDSTRFSVSTGDDLRQRGGSGLVERGFNPVVHVAGPLAVVWLPYDLYRNGEWVHCGIDSFTLVKSGPEWKIVNLTWTMEQPPACERHPDGPPR